MSEALQIETRDSVCVGCPLAVEAEGMGGYLKCTWTPVAPLPWFLTWATPPGAFYRPRREPVESLGFQCAAKDAALAAQRRAGSSRVDAIHYRDLSGALLREEPMALKRLYAVGDDLVLDGARYVVRRVAVADGVQHVNLEQWVA